MSEHNENKGKLDIISSIQMNKPQIVPDKVNITLTIRNKKMMMAGVITMMKKKRLRTPEK